MTIRVGYVGVLSSTFGAEMRAMRSLTKPSWNLEDFGFDFISRNWVVRTDERTTMCGGGERCGSSCGGPFRRDGSSLEYDA